MNKRSLSGVVLLIAVLMPGSASAALIFSDIELAVSTRGSGPGVVVPDSELLAIPPGGSGGAEALTRAGGDPFPNQPNTVGSAFASAAQIALGGSILPGVGANGFFVRNALHTLFAEASIKQTITNSSPDAGSVLGNFFIPEPTMRFFGVGDFFPGGADPARDASAFVQARLDIKHTNVFGTIVEETLIDYGMLAFRDPQTGVLSAKTTDGGLRLTRGQEPDGSFVFRMPELKLVNIALPEVGPRETLEVTYIFTAAASTGFGETGVFAAIGDPFNLGTSGGNFALQPGASPSAIPEPGTMATLCVGFMVLGVCARRRRSRHLPMPGKRSQPASVQRGQSTGRSA